MSAMQCKWPPEVPVISSGSLALDVALGVGGIPRGCITEIYGPAAAGKTTLALHMIAKVQGDRGVAAFIDAEHAFDPGYARNLGVKSPVLFISQPDTGEQALEIVEVLVRSGAVDVIIIDSVAALVPKAELNGSIGNAPLGMHTQLLAQGLCRLAAVVGKTHTCVIFLNQLRQKIGTTLTSAAATSGESALKSYATVRLEVRRLHPLKQGNTSVGYRSRVRVVKNKLAPPFRQVEFDMFYGKGISREGELLDLALAQGLITRRGTRFLYKDRELGQNPEQVKAFLQTAAELSREIEIQIRQGLGVPCCDPAEGEGGRGKKTEK